MDRLRRLLALRPGEGRPVGLAVAVSLFAAAGLMIGQSASEALFFSKYGVDKLPVMYLALGGTMVVATLGIGVVLSRLGRARACLLIPVAISVVAVAGRLGLVAGATWIYPGLWLLQGVGYFVLGLSVWGLAGIVTDTRQAKRFFPLVGGGGVLGQVIGGLLTKPLAALLGTPNLLLVWAATLVAVVWFGRKLTAIGAERGTSVQRRRDRAPNPIGELKEGFRYVRRSPLMRWMAVGSVVFSLLFFSLYLPFSRAATAHYPDPDALAGFLGAYYAASTGVAFLMSLVVTNRLFARFGVPRLMLVLPVLYALGFGILAINEAFAVLLVFRFAQVAWLQGGAVSAWESVTNVVPPERRDQTRAFLYGGPTQVGTILAGVFALLGESALSPSFLYAVGFASALVAIVAMYRVKGAYLRELVQALREGRPRIFDASSGGQDPFGLARTDSSAVAAAVAGLSDPDPRARRVSAHILGDLDDAGATASLIGALADEDADVRASALGSLGRAGTDSALPDVLGRLADPDPNVRVAALDAAGALVSQDGAGMDDARPLLDDPDPFVRARAAALLDGSDAAAEATLVKLAGATDPEVRAAAFHAMRGAGALDVLDAALADPSDVVRDAAAESLGTLGAAATQAVVRSLGIPERRRGALIALDRLPLTGGERDDVRRFAADAVARAVDSYTVATAIQEDGDERLALLRDSLLLRSEQNAVAGLRAAAVLGDRSAMTVALESISVTDPTQRANALEVIESVGERDLVRPLLTMWEAAASGATDQAGLERLRADPDEWIRACAELVATKSEGEAMTKSLDVLPLMERVLFLRKVPLFADLAPPDLQPIARIAEEQSFSDGDAIAEQGESGEAMFVIVSGEVAVVVHGDPGERVVAVRPAGDVVGEMSVITSQPRMAGLVARGPVRVLSIERRQFESILRERPETSLGVIKVLCQRLAAVGGEEG